MKLRFILATVAICAALPLKVAHAAPQLLGLLAESNLPLHCINGTCSVEVSAICLQEERAMPAWETANREVQPSQIKVAGTGADGRVAEMAIGDIAHIESDRGSWAVKISIPEEKLQAIALSQAALAIEGRVALAPIPVPDDRNPQTAEEINTIVAAFVNSPESVIDETATDMAAAHVLNEMINALPHVTLDESKPAGDLWRKVFGSNTQSQPGMRQAAAYYRLCGHELLMVDRATVRRCLELGHDNFVTTVNRRYWDSNKPGV